LESKDIGFRKAEFVAKTQFLLVAIAMVLQHFPLNPTISSVRVLQITALHTESLVEGGKERKYCLQMPSIIDVKKQTV